MTQIPYNTTAQYIAQKEFLQKVSDQFLHSSRSRKSIHILGISCSSTNQDDTPPRVPSSHRLLLDILDIAKRIDPELHVETKYTVLEELGFDHCEGNYSVQGHYCTWPCWISQRKAQKGIADPLTQLYNDMLDWADIVLITTPIRWGNASSLYYTFVERCNCIENQKEVYGVDLVHNKLMGSIVVGAQDGVQHVLGSIMSTWSQMGFSFAKQPFVGYTAGGYLNDRIDLVSQQLDNDREILLENAKEMLENQFATIVARRLLEQSL